MIVAAILFRRIVIYQDNNLNVIKNDKDEQLVKQKVNPIISQIQRTFEKWWRRLCPERQKAVWKRLERIQQDAERRIVTNGCINVDDDTYNKLQQYSRLIIE